MIKIIKQLGPTRFEVEIPLRDKTHNNITMAVVHDYIRFDTTICIQGESSVSLDHGHTGGNCNIVFTDHSIQIPIAVMVNSILPALNEHKYCQPEHMNSGSYNYGSKNLIWNNSDGRKMISVLIEGNETPNVIPYDLYLKLAGKDT